MPSACSVSRHLLQNVQGQTVKDVEGLDKTTAIAAHPSHILASQYREAEFWGRPNDTPERVAVCNPLVGDEETIKMALLGRYESQSWPDIDEDLAAGKAFAERRYALDAKLYKAGRAKGYDAIILLSPASFARFKTEGRIPLSIELNLLAGFAK